MRTNPHRHSDIVDKLVELWDVWTMRALIGVNILVLGVLIGMKMVG